MNRPVRSVTLLVALVAALVLVGVLIWRLIVGAGPPVQTSAYSETFDTAGSWTAGFGANAEGVVEDGVYNMSIDLSGDTFWATAGRNLADGVYEVEATPLEGTLDNGYGMIFRVDGGEQSFYVFKISSDGYVFIGHCAENCAQTESLVGQDWFPSPAVNQGLGITNHIRVIASGPEMIYYVNGIEVGQIFDETLENGDIGLLAETLSPGGLRVAFDNFKVTPLETN